ncbi:auxin transporter-like protein 2 [Lactuca sativa]|uniref:auxin transporter-like protein 2 n=1 Tax=Lactuca sativa TaxID=4236 RepID=UPI0022AEBF8E|nr:auxin transporter-like protein 2 [Lactuca sativa]
MVPNKQAEGAIVPGEMKGSNEQEQGEGQVGVDQSVSAVKNFLWHGGSAYNGRFSCVSNQESSFKSFMDSLVLEAGLLFSVLYVQYRARKETENVSFRNHVIQMIPHGRMYPYPMVATFLVDSCGESPYTMVTVHRLLYQ